jgi:pyruvate formate lyase activating enzyme
LGKISWVKIDMTGIIFDMKEFAINDGPGIRLTVFFKGCPMRCWWCHNPESFSTEPQMNNLSGKIVGKQWTSDALAEYILRFRDIFELTDGGVTFSGGEPMVQSGFLLDVIDKLTGIHKNLDTSGFCDPKIFKAVFIKCDLVFFDLKLGVDGDHEKYTGCPNTGILYNLTQLAGSDIPYHIRIPLIPNITDTVENLVILQQIILSLQKKPLQIDLLPYNRLAGGKYSAYGLNYPLEGEDNVNNTDNIGNFIDNIIKQGFKAGVVK